jgi:hypothetical protein
MTNNSSVEDDEAFIAAILALEAQIRSPEGAAFVAEYFSELLASKHSRPDPRNNPTSTSSPGLGEPLPPKLRTLVDEYHTANKLILEKLIEHGGSDLAYEEVNNRQNATEWRVRSLVFKDRPNVHQVMTVHYKQVERCDGSRADVPHIRGGQYIDLFYSMLMRQHLSRGELNIVLSQIDSQLQVAIAARQTVYDWHKKLPAGDVRVRGMHGHGVFLQKLKILREVVSQKLRVFG